MPLFSLWEAKLFSFRSLRLLEKWRHIGFSLLGLNVVGNQDLCILIDLDGVHDEVRDHGMILALSAGNAWKQSVLNVDQGYWSSEGWLPTRHNSWRLHAAGWWLWRNGMLSWALLPTMNSSRRIPWKEIWMRRCCWIWSDRTRLVHPFLGYWGRPNINQAHL